MNSLFQNTKYEIRNTKHAAAFSLTEVLLAVGTLAVGMLFIAGVFPVSIHFTTVAAERTIAAAAADEAFAKIKLYGISDANLSYVSQNLYENVALTRPPDGEFAYPSTPTTNPALKRYWWSAICRRVGPTDVQVTVFVSRKAGNTKFYVLNSNPPPIFNNTNDYPVAVPVEVTGVIGSDTLTITGNLGGKNWINDGYTIVDDATGNIYRVLERYRDDPTTPLPNDESRIIRLDKSWTGSTPQKVWTIPASAINPQPATIGRYPCIAVYQKVMRF